MHTTEKLLVILMLYYSFLKTVRVQVQLAQSQYCGPDRFDLVESFGCFPSCWHTWSGRFHCMYTSRHVQDMRHFWSQRSILCSDGVWTAEIPGSVLFMSYAIVWPGATRQQGVTTTEQTWVYSLGPLHYFPLSAFLPLIPPSLSTFCSCSNEEVTGNEHIIVCFWGAKGIFILNGCCAAFGCFLFILSITSRTFYS